MGKSIKRREARSKPGTGGAATAAGIWYQALWCALQTTTARFDEPSEGKKPAELRLILEPVAGGDVQVERPSSRRVVQLKTLSHGTWSLRDVIEQVLPDLYKAVDPSLKDVTYEFITEGRRGQWHEVEQFFRSLKRRLDSATAKDVWRSLSRRRSLATAGARGAFWNGYKMTEYGIVRRILDSLRARPCWQHEPLPVTREKVVALLAGFRFDGGHAERQVRDQLDECLLRMVERREELSNVRDGMIGRLIDLARNNDSTFGPQDLLAEYGLQGIVRLSNRAEIQSRSQSRVREAVTRVGYDSAWDVRQTIDEHRNCSNCPPFVAVCGDSGNGKSWWLAAAALASDSLSTVMFDSAGNAATDLHRASDHFWRSVLGHDGAVTLENAARRVRGALGHESVWLTICMDRLESVREALDLLGQPWEAWGVRVIAACSMEVAEALKQAGGKHPDAVDIIDVGAFTHDELRTYLKRRIGDTWVHVPSDLNDVLKKPQLAAMYCDLICDPPSHGSAIATWLPRSEFELIDAYWDRLQSGEAPLDERCVRAIAGHLIDGSAYPCNADQIHAAGMDNAAILRLTRSGWLRREPSNRYAIPHERLVSFAVAKELAARYEQNQMDAKMVAGRLITMDRFPKLPLDWFFVASESTATSQVGDVLAFLAERLDPLDRMTLYSELLPSIGNYAAPLLRERLVMLAEGGRWWELRSVVSGLAKYSVDELRDDIAQLLSDARPQVRRAAVQLLAKRPLTGHLDRVWNLHCRMQADPEQFGDAESIRRHDLYTDAFDALRACVRLEPASLRSAIHHADPATEPVQDLAYLVANLDDGGVMWRECKADLFAKLPLQKSRALALNIGLWRDDAESARLDDWITVADDLLGPMAVWALARIEPARAIMALQRLPRQLLYVCRGWFLPRLFLAAANETRNALRERLRTSDAPLRDALVFQGHENEMDASTVDLILDHLTQALREDAVAAASETDEPPKQARDLRNSLMPLLELLAGVGSPTVLDSIAAPCNSDTEHQLAQFLERIGARTSMMQDSLARQPALAVLHSIGGQGYRDVVASFLGAASRYGRLDAIDAAKVDADESILASLRAAVMDEELWDGTTPLLQMEALRALAIHGDVEGLCAGMLRLGLRAPDDIHEWMSAVTPAVDATNRVHNIVQKGSGRELQGAILTLGLMQSHSAADDLARALRDSTDEDALLAAVIALGRLRVASPDAITLIARSMDRPRCRYSATRTLLSIATVDAHAQLMRSLQAQWDPQIAVALTDSPHVGKEATDLIAERLLTTRLGDAPRDPWSDDLYCLLAAGPEEALTDVIQRCPNVHEELRTASLAAEGTLWIVGSKALAIRGLAAFDPSTAQLAARKALILPDSNDRHLYPAVLYRLNADLARDVFLSLAADEPNPAVLWSMAHSLQSRDVNWLVDALAAPASDTRRAAVRLVSGPNGRQDRVSQRILRLLDDESDRVVRAAEGSLKLTWRYTDAEQCAGRLESLVNPTVAQAWRWMGAALRVGHAGYDGGPVPLWAARILQSAPLRRHRGLGPLFRAKLQETRTKALNKANDEARRQSR